MAQTKTEQSENKNLERSEGRGEVSRRGDTSTGLWSDPTEIFRLGPFGMMRRMQEEMDRMMSGFWTGGGRTWSPAVEVREKDNNLIVCAELPGLDKDDVKVELTDDALVIHGNRQREHEEKQEGYYRSERSYGEFYRAVPLPEYAKGENAKANFHNGVLEVTVPLEENRGHKQRSIPIEGGTSERKPAAAQTGTTQEKTKTG